MNCIQSLCETHQVNLQQLEGSLNRHLSDFGEQSPERQMDITRKLDAAHVERMAPVYRALQNKSPNANLALYMNRDVGMVLFLRRWKAQVHFRMSNDGCRLQVSDVVPPGVDDKRPEFSTIDQAAAYVDQLNAF